MNKLLYVWFLLSMLIAPCSRCVAMQDNQEVSKDEAEKMGVSIRSHPNGDAGIAVWLEFKPLGILKNFTRVEVEISAKNKVLIKAPLLVSRSTANTVSSYFSVDPAYLADSVFTVVVQEGDRSRSGFRFRVKDFSEPSKSDTKAR